MSAIYCLPVTTCNMVFSMSLKPINLSALVPSKETKILTPEVTWPHTTIPLPCKLCVYEPELVIKSMNLTIIIVIYHFPFYIVILLDMFEFSFLPFNCITKYFLVVFLLIHGYNWYPVLFYMHNLFSLYFMLYNLFFIVSVHNFLLLNHITK